MEQLTNDNWGFASNCFVCEQRNASGLRIPFFHDEDAGTVTATFELDDRFSGAPSYVHGGLLLAIQDEAMAWASIAVAHRWSMTGETTTRFVHPVRVGRSYTVTAAIDELPSADAATLAARATIADEKGRPCAEAEATFVVLGEAHAAAAAGVELGDDHLGYTPSGVSARGTTFRLLAAGASGYLVGTFPSADIAARRAAGSIDLRDAGSGNPGALNAAAVLGRNWGLAVLGADMAKGAVAGGIGRRLAGDGGAYLAATASVAGHIAPVWKRFRGGKGVATSAGACLAVFPAYFPIDAAVAAVSAVAAQHAERSTQISCTAWNLAAVLWWRCSLSNGWGPRPSVGLVLFTATTSLMILAKFRGARPRPATAGP